MSNTQSKPILQRVVGAVFLLALIALVALLLLQPSDRLPDSTAKNSKPQQPTISITANDNPQPQAPIDNSRPTLVLESTTANNATQSLESDINTGASEVIGEDIWQSVEQQAIPDIQSEKPILVASVDGTSQTNNEKPLETPKAQTAPKNDTVKPVVTTPKLELIADSEKTATPKQTTQASAKPSQNGSWYVQIGAFGNAANAQKLVNQYQQQGYNVRIQKDNNLNRVQIGPFATKKEAEQVQTKTKTQSINPAVIHLP